MLSDILMLFDLIDTKKAFNNTFSLHRSSKVLKLGDVKRTFTCLVKRNNILSLAAIVLLNILVMCVPYVLFLFVNTPCEKLSTAFTWSQHTFTAPDNTFYYLSSAMQKCAFATHADSESPDQPAHLHSLIWAFTVCLQNYWIL